MFRAEEFTFAAPVARKAGGQPSLPPETVREIQRLMRPMVDLCGWYVELAKKYGVSPKTIRRYRNSR